MPRRIAPPRRTKGTAKAARTERGKVADGREAKPTEKVKEMEKEKGTKVLVSRAARSDTKLGSAEPNV